MQIISKVLGALQTNCYFVINGSQAIIIDPGAQPSVIKKVIDENKLTVTHILLTHGHSDHIGAVGEIKDCTGAKICIHADDADMLTDPKKNLSVYMGEPYTTYKADIILRDGDEFEAAGMRVKVIHTPGHTPGGVCYIIENEMFTGDTLFNMSIGRADFPGSSPEALDNSVVNVLGKIEKNYRVYPGHGPASALQQEQLMNPYMARGGLFD